MNPNPPERKVDLFGPAPEIEESKDDKLERLIMQANLFGTENNQNGTGSRNPDKEKRKRRREQKLARKRNRDR